MSRPAASSLHAFIVVAAMAVSAAADVKLPTFFSDNMVLQQGRKITIWGTAEPGVKVKVTLAGGANPASATNAGSGGAGDPASQAAANSPASEGAATADDKGNWQVALDERKASSDPLELIVEGETAKGGNKVVLKNILIGEVWICSGQSNMAWKLAAARDGDKEAAAADLPQIRLINVNSVTATQPASDIANKWVVCDPAAAARFSAVGFLFGKELHKELRVPIGLINSSWGGSAIQSWIPMSAYADDPDVKYSKPYIDNLLAKHPAALAALPAAVEKWKAATQAVAATRPQLASRPGGLPPPPKITDPAITYGGMYNGMIAPLGRLGAGGVIWYQGEANASPGSNYDKFLAAMVRSWRKAFGRDDLPFLWVQLPNFQPRKSDPNAVSGWAELRESQAKALALGGTGMAVTIDAGEARDIHPKDKHTPAHRLALAALGMVYRKDVQYLPPMLESIKTDGGKMIVKFRNCPGGLVNEGDAVRGFALAGADGKYHWADATIDGETAVVTCADVAAPVAVRYGWGDNPAVTLYNKARLPACPFRAGEQSFAAASQTTK